MFCQALLAVNRWINTIMKLKWLIQLLRIIFWEVRKNYMSKQSHCMLFWQIVSQTLNNSQSLLKAVSQEQTLLCIKMNQHLFNCKRNIYDRLFFHQFYFQIALLPIASFSQFMLGFLNSFWAISFNWCKKERCSNQSDTDISWWWPLKPEINQDISLNSILNTSVGDKVEVTSPLQSWLEAFDHSWRWSLWEASNPCWL